MDRKENLKLVSVRIEQRTLNKIEEFTKHRDYFTRSAVINKILSAVMLCSDDETIWDIVRVYSPETCGYTIDFHVDKKKLENLPKE